MSLMTPNETSSLKDMDAVPVVLAHFMQEMKFQNENNASRNNSEIEVLSIETDEEANGNIFDPFRIPLRHKINLQYAIGSESTDISVREVSNRNRNQTYIKEMDRLKAVVEGER